MKKYFIISIALLLVTGCIHAKKDEPLKAEFKYFLDVHFLKKNDDGTIVFLIKFELTEKSNRPVA